jgi:suppressor for copper-sensitivity B
MPVQNVCRALFLGLLWTLAAVTGTTAEAARSEAVSTPAVTARLLTAENGVAPEAGSISAGLELELGDGWKTYWRTPGEVGFPPEIDWAGSRNVAEVDFQWPAPTRFTAFGIENFGYHDGVVFPLRVYLEEPGAPVRLVAHVSLLACSDICVPQEFDLALEVPAGTGIDGKSAARITAFADRVPVDRAAAGVTEAVAFVDAGASELVLSLRRAIPFDAPDVFPELNDATSLGAPDIRLGEGGRLLWATLPILAALDGPLPELSLTVTDGTARAATLVPDPVAQRPTPPFVLGSVAPGAADLFWIALTAFIGGLVLNVMPCVLPVLSIKLGSAMRLDRSARTTIRRGFLASAAGVMTFMWGLAALLFALQKVGVTVGWGLQFQNPVFLALMVVLLAVFAANLAGGFEIALPSRLQTRLADAGGRTGYAGDFASGAFAAVLATPCSAPFLGTAIAFALSGRGVDIALVFTFLGLGLASPYLLTAAAPGMIRHLPKPGRWMLILRGLLGLLLGATALWLVWVLIGVAGSTATLAVVLLTAALVAALCLRRVPTLLRSAVAVPLAVLTLASASVLDLPSRSAPAAPVSAANIWADFDRVDIARRVSHGQVVFVDVTADWCLTCKANKALVLDREPVATALATSGVTAMRADWTRPDAAIARYLESFDRYGIPFNAVYGPLAPEGIVLPELLSTSAVMDALERAGASAVASES